jgi:hypothetical protein
MPRFFTPACIFCGTKPTTDEDIVPTWLGEFLEKKYGVQAGRFYVVPPADRPADRSVSWPTKGYKAIAKITCQRCNNTFLNAFDRRARRLLKGLFGGGKLTIDLSAESRGKLARWAFKEALLMPNAIRMQDTIPPIVYEDFCKTGDLPKNQVGIYVGACHPIHDRSLWITAIPLTSYQGRGETLTEARNKPMRAYRITFLIYNVIWQVYGIANPDRSFRHLPPNPSPYAPALIRLWPAFGGIRWPSTTLGEEAVADLLRQNTPLTFYRSPL